MKKFLLWMIPLIIVSCSKEDSPVVTNHDQDDKIQKERQYYESWKRVLQEDSVYFHDIQFVPDNCGFAAGTRDCGASGSKYNVTNGIVYKSTDMGETWTLAYESPNTAFYRIRMQNATTGWLLGKSGIMKTSNGGQDWAVKQTIAPKSFYPDDILILDNLRAIVSEQQSYASNNIYITQNSGESWQLSDWSKILHDSVRIQAMSRVDQSTIVLVGFTTRNVTKDSTSGKIFMFVSSDNGASWNKKTVDNNGFDFNFGLHFFDASNGYVFTSDRIYKTTDGGSSWSVTQLQGKYLASSPKTIYFKDRMNGWYVNLSSDILLRTTDGGNNWISCSWYYTNKITFVNETIGFIAGANFIARTTKGGD